MEQAGEIILRLNDVSKVYSGIVAVKRASLELRRDNAPALEIDAFAIPVFVHSTGGLVEAEGFQDEQAYEALVDSMKAAGLHNTAVVLARDTIFLTTILAVPALIVIAALLA